MSNTKELVKKILQSTQRIRRGRIPHKTLPKISAGMEVEIQIGNSVITGTAVKDSCRGFVLVSYVGLDGSKETRPTSLRLVTRIQE